MSRYTRDRLTDMTFSKLIDVVSKLEPDLSEYRAGCTTSPDEKKIKKIKEDVLAAAEMAANEEAEFGKLVNIEREEFKELMQTAIDTDVQLFKESLLKAFDIFKTHVRDKHSHLKELFEKINASMKEDSNDRGMVFDVDDGWVLVEDALKMAGVPSWIIDIYYDRPCTSPSAGEASRPSGGKKSRRKKTKRRHKIGGKKSRKQRKRATIKGGKRKRRRTRRRR